MPHLSNRPTPTANGRHPEQRLHVVATDGDPAVCEFYREALAAWGHELLVVGDGREAADLCRAARPDLLIAGAVPPGWDDQVPVIVVAAGPPPDGPDPADGPVLAYLGKPVHAAALRVAVAAAGRLRALRDEVAELRQALEDRKVIERAKGLLARYAGLSEADAYNRLRTLASDQNRKLVEVAQAVIAAAQVFHALEPTGEPRSQANGHAPFIRTDHRPPRRVAHPTASRSPRPIQSDQK
jgi:two-component system, response regulator PdtaR